MVSKTPIGPANCKPHVVGCCPKLSVYPPHRLPTSSAIASTTTRALQRRTTHRDPTPARAHTRQQQAPRGPAAQGSPSSPAAIWR